MLSELLARVRTRSRYRTAAIAGSGGLRDPVFEGLSRVGVSAKFEGRDESAFPANAAD
jgi:hypothetical protein